MDRRRADELRKIVTHRLCFLKIFTQAIDRRRRSWPRSLFLRQSEISHHIGKEPGVDPPFQTQPRPALDRKWCRLKWIRHESIYIKRRNLACFPRFQWRAPKNLCKRE